MVLNFYFLSLDFWKASVAVDKLEAGLMTGLEKFQYFFIGVVLCMTLSEYFIRITMRPGYVNYFDLAISVINLIIIFGGVIYLYKRHEQNAFGGSFMEKMVVVAVASLPRMILILGIPFFLLVVLVYTIMYGNAIPNSYTLLDVFLFSGFNVVYLYIFSRYFPVTQAPHLHTHHQA